MRITARDLRLVKDVALSHVLSRDQILALGYFDSVTRVNSRLRALRKLGYVRVLETPFFDQFLYAAGPKADQVVGERIARLLKGRTGSPRFLRHALSTTSVRLQLKKKGMTAWRFEQQARASFRYGSKALEVRPDGIAEFNDRIVAVEVDLGHVAPAKFREKLTAYQAFIASGECRRLWGKETFRLLTVTTGPQRAAALSRLTPKGASFEHRTVTFDQFEITTPGGWS